jgi:uncharacterized protein
LPSKLFFLLTKLPQCNKIQILERLAFTIMQKPAKKTRPSEAWASKLKAYFSNRKGAIIAYSGGVDSALLAYVAHLTLGNNMLAALADSPSLARREYRQAVAFAKQHDIPLQIIETREMQNPFYAANRGDRCYHCKKALFERIEELRLQPGTPISNSSWPIFYGVNLDDLADYRPGMQAADEAAIQAPYLELKMDKNAIRRACNFFGLEVADKPAMPCMASRIAYGQEVSVEKLKQVEAAEDFLSGLGFKVLRVRHHGDTARIEIAPEDFELAMEHRETISQKLHDLGFLYVTLDLDGFKSGSLNVALKDKKSQNRT